MGLDGGHVVFFFEVGGEEGAEDVVGVVGDEGGVFWLDVAGGVGGLEGTADAAADEEEEEEG